MTACDPVNRGSDEADWAAAATGGVVHTPAAGVTAAAAAAQLAVRCALRCALRWVGLL